MLQTQKPVTQTEAAHIRQPRPFGRLTFVAQGVFLLGLWLVLFGASLRTPPLLDDADATHAQAAQSMAATGDWVTLHVDGIRYLEKAPLPYWIVAISLRLFGDNAFAIHLPLALAVLGLTLLGYVWARRAFGATEAFYTALFTLTSTGVFLFTRIFIPDALLSLLLAFALYTMLRALEPDSNAYYAYAFWAAMAAAVLTKGLIAIVFLLGTALIFKVLLRDRCELRRLRPLSGLVLFLAIAAPWHILAGLRNTGGANGHGFFWFYFVNEHYLRFLGRHIPRDYNKLPTTLYWLLHLVWLFPWSLYTPTALLCAWRLRRERQLAAELDASGEQLSRFALMQQKKAHRKQASGIAADSFAERTVLLLSIFSLFVVCFFSLSTNQEYYTFPAYLPLLMLLAAAVTAAQQRQLHAALTITYASFTFLGLAIAAALGYGLWVSRHLPFTSDIGASLAHRGVGSYTLSMSHFFDLTGPSFAALRLPAALAAAAFLLGPFVAWALHRRNKPQAAVTSVALTSAAFLFAAHIALVRFAPMLSSQDFAVSLEQLEAANRIAPDTQILIYGDQAFGSSLPFYLHRRVLLVDGRTTSMLFGSTFADAPGIFLTHQQLLAQWATGPRKILFVPAERREEVDQLLGTHPILLKETSGKAFLTDRPLEPGNGDLR